MEERDQHDQKVQEQRRKETEEEYEEDGEGGILCAANEVESHLKLWAKTLRRPPRGHIKSFSEGIWRPELKACRVLKPKGNDMRAMGFGLDGNVHLYPEETLFLVERCKLEVSNITTAQLYEEVDLAHYLTYAYFRQTSLIVFRVNADCPVPISFEAYAPCSQFSKRNRGRPIFYVMYGRTRSAVPTDDELVEVFKWADGVPVKYAMVSDEGGVFAVNLAPRPLINQTPNQLKSRNNNNNNRGQNKRQKVERVQETSSQGKEEGNGEGEKEGGAEKGQEEIEKESVTEEEADTGKANNADVNQKDGAEERGKGGEVGEDEDTTNKPADDAVEMERGDSQAS